MSLEPITRKEQYLNAIATGSANAEIPDPITREEMYLKRIYESALSGGGSGGAQVQADWDETDASSPAFIKNKPFEKTEFSTKWDGTPTSVSFQPSDDKFYRVADVTPMADEIQNINCALNITGMGDMPIDLQVRYESTQNATWFMSAEFSATPIVILYEGNIFGADVGVYIVDLQVVSGMLGVPINSVSISWTQYKRVEMEYLPSAIKITRYTARIPDVTSSTATLDRYVDVSSDAIIVSIEIEGTDIRTQFFCGVKQDLSGTISFQGASVSGAYVEVINNSVTIHNI